MEHSTNVSLLARLAEGVDANAWNEFRDRYEELILGFGRRFGLQQTDCDDIAQEVLMALSQSMGDFRYDPAKGKFRSFLKTLTTRMIFRRIRQRQASGVQLSNEAADMAGVGDERLEALWEAEWQRYHIRQAMASLAAEFKEQDRMAFTYYAVQGWSASATAEALGMSLDQVYQAKSRILKRLSELIAEQVADEG